jgi:hypothetical protein
MNNWLANQCRGFSLIRKDKNKYNDDYAALADAYQEWTAARTYFEQVTDPDLIDYAILSLQAAEKRYVYLWKKVRKKEQVWEESI